MGHNTAEGQASQMHRCSPVCSAAYLFPRSGRPAVVVMFFSSLLNVGCALRHLFAIESSQLSIGRKCELLSVGWC